MTCGGTLVSSVRKDLLHYAFKKNLLHYAFKKALQPLESSPLVQQDFAETTGLEVPRFGLEHVHSTKNTGMQFDLHCSIGCGARPLYLCICNRTFEIVHPWRKTEGEPPREAM